MITLGDHAIEAANPGAVQRIAELEREIARRRTARPDCPLCGSRGYVLGWPGTPTGPMDELECECIEEAAAS